MPWTLHQHRVRVTHDGARRGAAAYAPRLVQTTRTSRRALVFFSVACFTLAALAPSARADKCGKAQEALEKCQEKSEAKLDRCTPINCFDSVHQ